jgi:RNA polymerase sigma-70 factor, ECF subfamily
MSTILTSEARCSNQSSAVERPYIGYLGVIAGAAVRSATISPRQNRHTDNHQYETASQPAYLMNHDQFRGLFDSHAAFVWRVLARHGVPRRELDDGCQEVFLVLYRRANELIAGSNVRTWLYGVAVRVALGMRRRAYHRRELLTEVALEQGGPAQPFEALWSRELHQQLTAALATLPRVRREVFVLYELEDMTIGEAAEALGVPENTAMYRLHAARDAIVSFVRKRELTSDIARARARRRVEGAS